MNRKHRKRASLVQRDHRVWVTLKSSWDTDWSGHRLCSLGSSGEENDRQTVQVRRMAVRQTITSEPVEPLFFVRT